jgi:branched-chain amino acid transport system ATP-binding protein
MLLEIKELWVRYDLVEALRGISLNLAQSEIVTILGANGAGKSTTLKTVSGLKEPGSGEIWFREERIDGLPPHEVVRRGIAQVPEGRRIFPEMTVMDNLLMGTHLRKDSTAVKRDLNTFLPIFRSCRSAKISKGAASAGANSKCWPWPEP